MDERAARTILDAAGAEARSPGRTLARAYRELSDGYRAGAATPGDLSADQALAYLAARLPATAAVLSEVLAAVAAVRPDWRPASVLDLGAGPGPATWAAAEAFPSVGTATLVERSAEMIRVGRRLAARSGASAVRDASWVRGSVTDPLPGGADLLLASYVLGEIDPALRPRTLATWWAATTGELVLVEPGTPAGFARILAARDQLLAAGATVTAPCPSDAGCPMAGGDWCHFGKRLARSALHRTVKDAELGFEDEKYCYLAASRQQAAHAAARILRPPRVRPGHIRFTVCTAPTTRELVVTRGRKDDFRWARKAGWGDAVPAGVVT